jgi:hypothetical protein
MNFDIKLRNGSNSQKKKTATLVDAARYIRLKLELCYFGLDEAMKGEVPASVNLSGAGSTCRNMGFMPQGYEIDFYGAGLGTSFCSLLGGLKRRLALGSISFMAAVSLTGVQAPPAQAAMAAPVTVVSQAATGIIKSETPLINNSRIDNFINSALKLSNNNSHRVIAAVAQHYNTVDPHINVHTDHINTGHADVHTDHFNTVHNNAHADHSNTVHSNAPGYNHNNTLHTNGPIWSNVEPAHGNVPWQNVAHQNIGPHTNITATSYTADYIY